MASEAHALYILGKLEKLWKSELHVDCIIESRDGEIKCHQILLSSVAKAIKIKRTIEADNRTINYNLCVTTSVKDVSHFLSLLYRTSAAKSDGYNRDLITTANLFGMDIALYQTGKLPRSTTSSTDVIMEKFRRQRNSAFAEQLQKLHASKSLSDITLVVDNRHFHCHKVILVAVSAYFEALFSSELSEMHQTEIEIHDVDMKTFKLVLDFIYTGNNIITMVNFQQILSTSSYLQIPLLQSQCESFIARHIDNDNCIDVATLGDMYGSNYLISKAVSYICRNFEHISETKQFLTLRKNVLFRILRSDQINTEDEHILLQAVLLWLKHQSGEVEMLEVLENIRLTYISDSELTEMLHSPHFRKKEECVNYIKDFMKNKIPQNGNNRTYKTEEVLVTMWSSSYRPGLFLACYSFTSNVWYQLPCLPNHLTGCSYGACSNESDLYICGGTGNLTSFKQFNFASNKWCDLGPMQQKYGRADHSVVMKNETIYMIGGSTDQIHTWPYIDRYNTQSKSYDRIGSLCIAVMNPTCTIVDDAIIIFGGNKSLGEYVSSIQQFDLSSNSCTLLSKLPIMCSYSGIAVNEDIVYIVGPKGDVVLYENGKDPIILGSIFKQTMFGFGTVYYKGKVYVFGGKSDRFESVEARCFDTLTKSCCVTNKNMKIPAKKESNQYYVTIQTIRTSVLITNNLCQHPS